MNYKAIELAEQDIEGREVTGIASVFGNIDSYGDIVHKGAFAKTVQEQRSRIRHLWGHDTSQPPIATVVDLREVSRDELPADVLSKAPEAAGGLQVVRRYLDVPLAEWVLSSLRDGAVNEMSFAYDIIRAEPGTIKRDDGETVSVLHLRELRLYETSDVLWGANDATVTGKSLSNSIKQLASMVDALELKFETLDAVSDDELAAATAAAERLEAILKLAEPPASAADTVTAAAALTEAMRRRIDVAERLLV